jgi:hypothetical protein
MYYIRATRLHLKTQNETYFGHLVHAVKISMLLGAMAIQCLIHSVLPFMFTTAVSDNIEQVERLAKRRTK